MRKKRQKNKECKRHMEYSKRSNIHIIGVPEEERQRRGGGQKQYLKKSWVRIFKH